MVLSEKLHKTGGSHIDFHSLGPFWDVKNPVITAALPGDFFCAQKCSHFSAIIQILVSFSFFKVPIKTEVGQFDFILWFIYVLCVLKIPGDNFQRFI